jgi:hypothetical protein
MIVCTANFWLLQPIISQMQWAMKQYIAMLSGQAATLKLITFEHFAEINKFQETTISSLIHKMKLDRITTKFFRTPQAKKH